MSLSLLVLMALLVLAYPRTGFGAYFLFSFALFIALSWLISPSYDHTHFIQKAASYTSLHEAILDESEAISPISPMIRILSSITNTTFEKAAILLNSIFLPLIFENITFLLEPRRKLNAVTFVLVLMVSCFLFPTTMALMISANKDLCLAFALSVFFRSVYILFSQNQAIRTKVVNMLSVSLAFILINQLRPYFASMIIATISIFLITRIPRNLTKNLRNMWFITLVYTTCFAALVMKWESIRVLLETYYGRATIWPVYYAEKPSIFTGSFYPIISFFYLIFYPLTLFFTNPEVTDQNALLGILQSTSFILGILILLKRVYQREDIQYAILAIFCGLHCLIQPWGSPNVGALMRLTFIETVIFSVLISLNLRNFLFQPLKCMREI